MMKEKIYLSSHHKMMKNMYFKFLPSISTLHIYNN